MARVLHLDIETIPDQREEALEEIREQIQAPGNYKKPESIQAWLDENRDAEAERRWLRTALDGTRGEICAIGFALDDGEVVASGRLPSERSEADFLKAFWDTVADVTSIKVRGKNTMPAQDLIWAGHNIVGFDIKFLYQRSVINKVRPTIPFPHNARGWDEKRVFDTMVMWAKSTNIADFVSADRLARVLGLPGKGEMDGSMVWEAIKNGELSKVVDYVRDDVIQQREIFHRMTFDQYRTLDYDHDLEAALP